MHGGGHFHLPECCVISARSADVYILCKLETFCECGGGLNYGEWLELAVYSALLHC